MRIHGNKPSRPARARASWRAVVAGAALAVAGALAACSDAPSGPGLASAPAAPSLAKGGNGNGSKPGQPGASGDTVWTGEALATPIVATSLARLQPLADTVSATFQVTRDGGTFTVPGTGLEIQVPKNAVKDDFAMTVKALPGTLVAYEFGPHGLQFKKSLIMVQSLAGTDYASRPGATFDAGYFSSLGDVDGNSGKAIVRERLQNAFDAATGKFTFAVNHFSGYMVSWGFRGDDDDQGQNQQD